jgi:hypothetical protein
MIEELRRRIAELEEVKENIDDERLLSIIDNEIDSIIDSISEIQCNY